MPTIFHPSSRIELAKKHRFDLTRNSLEAAAFALSEGGSILAARFKASPTSSIRGLDAMVEGAHLISPTNDFVSDTTPTLTWRTTAHSVSRLFVSTFSAGNGLYPNDLGITDLNPYRIVNGVEVTADANGLAQFTIPFTAQLTAGQTYYWGVEVSSSDGRSIRRGSVFQTEAKSEEVTDRFNSVTLLTHGFTPDPGGWLKDNALERTPDSFIDMAKMIAQRGGDGVVMIYNRQTGEFLSLDGRAPIPGRPLVLVSDWVKESTVNDSGFSEAAADALFASLMKMDKALDGKILRSPLHFVAHSRGTVVNSEILQRLGTYFPNITNIQMTTLDAHDLPQPSLDLEVAKVGKVLAKLNQTELSPCQTESPTIKSRLSCWAANVTAKILESDQFEKLTNALAGLGKLQNLHYADFRDPLVQVWENVAFADNYFQDLGRASQSITPNGYSIPAAEINLRLHSDQRGDIVNGRAGFTQDDFVGTALAGIGLGGVAGPHSRVWKWYAGTVDLSVTEFESERIWRRLFDANYSRPLSAGIPVQYNEVPWYQALEGANYDGSVPQISEGIGTGWFYSVLGGGVELRLPKGERVPVSYDNTLPDDYADDEIRDAVPSLYNGDFEAGTLFLGRYDHRQESFVGAERRFPSYWAIPGWFFHNGNASAGNRAAQYLVKDSASGDYSVKLDRDNASIVHNRFFVDDAHSLKFSLLSESANGSLKIVAMQDGAVAFERTIDLTGMSKGLAQEIILPVTLDGVIDSLSFSFSGSGSIQLDDINLDGGLTLTDSSGDANDGIVLVMPTPPSDSEGEEFTLKDSFTLKNDSSDDWVSRGIVIHDADKISSLNVFYGSSQIPLEFKSFKDACVVIVTGQGAYDDLVLVHGIDESCKPLFSPNLANLTLNKGEELKFTVSREDLPNKPYDRSVDLADLPVIEFSMTTVEFVYAPATRLSATESDRGTFIFMDQHDDDPQDAIATMLPVQQSRYKDEFLREMLVGLNVSTDSLIGGMHLTFLDGNSNWKTTAGDFSIRYKGPLGSGTNPATPSVTDTAFSGYQRNTIHFSSASVREHVMPLALMVKIGGHWRNIEANVPLNVKIKVMPSFVFFEGNPLERVEIIEKARSGRLGTDAKEAVDWLDAQVNNDRSQANADFIVGQAIGRSRFVGESNPILPFINNGLQFQPSAPTSSGTSVFSSTFLPDVATNRERITMGQSAVGGDPVGFSEDIELDSTNLQYLPKVISEDHPWAQIYRTAKTINEPIQLPPVQVFLTEIIIAYVKHAKTYGGNWRELGIRAAGVTYHELAHSLGLIDRYDFDGYERILAIINEMRKAAGDSEIVPGPDREAGWERIGMILPDPLHAGLMNGITDFRTPEYKYLAQEEIVFLALRLGLSSSELYKRLNNVPLRQDYSTYFGKNDVRNNVHTRAGQFVNWYAGAVDFLAHTYSYFFDKVYTLGTVANTLTPPAPSPTPARALPNLGGSASVEPQGGSNPPTAAYNSPQSANATAENTDAVRYRYSRLQPNAKVDGGDADLGQGFLRGFSTRVSIVPSTQGHTPDTLLHRDVEAAQWSIEKSPTFDVNIDDLEYDLNNIQFVGLADGVRVGTGDLRLKAQDEIGFDLFLRASNGDRIPVTTTRLLKSGKLDGMELIAVATGVPNEAYYANRILLKQDGSKEVAKTLISGDPNDGTIEWRVQLAFDTLEDDSVFALYSPKQVISDEQVIRVDEGPTWLIGAGTQIQFDQSQLAYKFDTVIPQFANFSVGDGTIPDFVKQYFGNDAKTYVEAGMGVTATIPISVLGSAKLQPKTAVLKVMILGSELANVVKPLGSESFDSLIFLEPDTLLPAGGRITVGPFPIADLAVKPDPLVMSSGVNVVSVAGVPVPLQHDLRAELDTKLNATWSAGLEFEVRDGVVHLNPNGTFVAVDGKAKGRIDVSATAGVPLIASVSGQLTVAAEQQSHFIGRFEATMADGRVSIQRPVFEDSWASLQVCGTVNLKGKAILFGEASTSFGPYNLTKQSAGNDQVVTLFGTVPDNIRTAACKAEPVRLVGEQLIKIAEGTPGQQIEIALTESLDVSPEQAANIRAKVELIEKAGQVVQNRATIVDDFKRTTYAQLANVREEAGKTIALSSSMLSLTTTLRKVSSRLQVSSLWTAYPQPSKYNRWRSSSIS